MKIKPAGLLAALQDGRRPIRCCYFCGPDEAGAENAALKAAALLAPDSERLELTGADLKRDPVRLSDEALATSLFAGSRHILVRAAGDDAHDAVANLLDVEGSPCPVLVLATGATDKSRIAKLLTPRDDALVAMYYQPEPRMVAGEVRTMGAAAGLRLTGELAERIARAGLYDLRLARSEVAKLALYLDAAPEQPRTVDGHALDAILTRSDDDGFAAVVSTVLGGQTARLAAELARIDELEINPVGIALALERRAAQLAALAGRLGERGDVKRFIEEEAAARRVFFRDQQELGQQLARWRGRRLDRLVARLARLHLQLLANSQSALLLLSQELTLITRAAASVR